MRIRRVERLPGRVARIERVGKAGVDICIAQRLEFLAVAAPEGIEHHAIGAFGAGHEQAHVKPAIGGNDRTDARFGGGIEIAGFRHRRREAVRRGGVRFGQARRQRAGRAQRVGLLDAAADRLLVLLGPAAQDRIEPQAQEGRDHGQDDDLNNHTHMSRKGGPGLPIHVSAARIATG
jgi:hypothetical protein